MMKFEIKHQEEYSRGELLLRTFFGPIYIGIPHGICLMFLGVLVGLLRFIAFFVILFTGRLPKGTYDYMSQFLKWLLRVQARMFNLSDGYPAFGLDATEDQTDFSIPYNELYSRGTAAVVFFFGPLILLPHILCMYGLMIGAIFVSIGAWFIVLFTGKYPTGMHTYMTRVLRWWYRIMLFLFFMNAIYPPFSGKSDEELAGGSDILDSKI